MKITTRFLKLFFLLSLVIPFHFSSSALAGAPPPYEQLGSISGYKFNDLNSNGTDNNEPRLSNWKIELYRLSPLEKISETTTNSSGAFYFQSLPLQSYRVCEVLPDVTPPWIPTRPLCVDVTLSPKNTTGFVLFGNHRDDTQLGCTRTQGYWGSSPQGSQRLIELVPSTLSLGSVQYTALQLDQILDSPTSGNALLILAHQLIAAKLNILNGASGTSILSTISSADSAIGALIIPPIGSSVVPPSSTAGQNMTSLATQLDLYNNGELDVPHCD